MGSAMRRLRRGVKESRVELARGVAELDDAAMRVRGRGKLTAMQYAYAVTDEVSAIEPEDNDG